MSFRKRPKKSDVANGEDRRNGTGHKAEPARAQKGASARVRPAAKAVRSTEGSRKARAQRRVDEARPLVTRGTRGGARHEKPLRGEKPVRGEKSVEKPVETRGRRQPYLVRGSEAPLRRGERNAAPGRGAPGAGGGAGRAEREGAGRAGAGREGAGRAGAGRAGAGRAGTGRAGRDAGRAGAGRVGAGREGTGRSGSDRTGGEREGAGRAGAGRAGAGRVGAGRNGSDRAGAEREGAGRAGSGRAGAGRTGAGRAGAGRVAADRVGGGRVGADRAGGGRAGADRAGAGKAVRGRVPARADAVRGRSSPARGERSLPARGARTDARGGRAEPRFAREAGRDERAAKPEVGETPVRKTSMPRPPKPVERKRPDMSAEPHPGHFLLTTREGSEQDLVDELVLAGVVDPPPRVLGPSLVLAPKVPKHEKRPINLTFARQGFPVVQSVHAHDLDAIAQRVSRSLRGQLEKAKEYALHVWVPDSDIGNPLAALAEELESKVARALETTLPDARRVDDGALRRMASLPFAQVCLIDTERAVAGVTYSNAAISLAKGGRTRVRVTGDFPSRAARKLEEALSWLGVEPGPGELCVDLGAAPGGWTYVLANRRARVIAIDPAKLRPEILAKKGVSHIQESAFTYQPAEPVDWLFCDMAWRPLEAAALLAKWGRRRWARMMIANIKLPMTKKAEMIARIKYILENEGDWKHIRTKQLYHDRDEITLSAHVS